MAYLGWFGVSKDGEHQHHAALLENIFAFFFSRRRCNTIAGINKDLDRPDPELIMKYVEELEEELFGEQADNQELKEEIERLRELVLSDSKRLFELERLLRQRATMVSDLVNEINVLRGDGTNTLRPFR